MEPPRIVGSVLAPPWQRLKLSHPGSLRVQSKVHAGTGLIVLPASRTSNSSFSSLGRKASAFAVCAVLAALAQPLYRDDYPARDLQIQNLQLFV